MVLEKDEAILKMGWDGDVRARVLRCSDILLIFGLSRLSSHEIVRFVLNISMQYAGICNREVHCFKTSEKGGGLRRNICS